MATKIDADFFAEVGLADLPKDDREGLVPIIIEDLEMRVGSQLASGLSDAQLAEFEILMAERDEAGAVAWLERNAPDYKSVVLAQLEQIKDELRERSSQILAACGG